MSHRVTHQIRNHQIGAAVLLVLGILFGYLAVPSGRPVSHTNFVLAAVFLFLAGANLLRTMILARRLSLGLDWVQTATLNVIAGRSREIMEPAGGTGIPEIETLLQTLKKYQGTLNQDREAPNERLLAIIRGLQGGLVVMTEDGQVSLVNGAGKDLLGARRVKVGTSLFASLTRESVVEALEKARERRRPFAANFQRLDGADLSGRISPLPDGEGAIILFPADEVTRNRATLDFDLSLHDTPPTPSHLSLDRSLVDLSMLIMDTETTGLSATEDRIVSFGAVWAHGTRMYRGRMADHLVNPGVPVPKSSSAVHGITDEMVADAPAWPEIYAEFLNMARHRVIVGHGTPFDLTIMKAECERHGLLWEDLVFIDTLRLASLLNPTMKSFDLEDLAVFYQIDLHGRHTALGDAMVCAELFFRMIPRLQMQGIRTLGNLLDVHGREAVDVIAKQREAGWIIDQPAEFRRG